MDYEKKYKEAIERLRNAFHDNNSRMCEEYRNAALKIIEPIFPELREESEDERIRKALINGLKRYDDGTLFNGCLVREILAWLEKQGEQKPAEVRTTGYWNVQDIEQTPTDKVEPKFKVGDKIYLKPEYRMPDDDTPIANTVFEIRAIDDKHYKFDGSYIFIEDQDKYELVEQKPAWSEKDIRMIGNIRSIVERYAFSQSAVDVNGELCEKEYIEADNWLKSLRPQNRWMPSDEQMDALNDVISSRDIKYDVLSELWKDLKKLTE